MTQITLYFLFFLVLGFKCTPAEQTQIFNYDGYNLNPFPERCLEILNTFANYASNFTMCSILYARPIRLCERCIEQYMQFKEKYKELISTVVNGTSCGSIYISRDRLDAVLEYHDSILSVWNKANCNACYDWSDDKPTLSNGTKRFNKMYKDTTECITTSWRPDQNNSEAICEKCMQSYLLLDNYYKSVSNDNIGVDTVCMDVVDSMNATRFIWSKSLNCCKLRKSPELIFLCIAGIISALPLLFYRAVRYCGPIRDLPNALRQSRFKQMFLRSDTRGIN